MQMLQSPEVARDKYMPRLDVLLKDLAKQAIDTFFVRAGDVLSAALVYAGTHWLAFQTKQFALFNLGLVSVWIILSIMIGLENKRLINITDRKPVAEKTR